MERKPFLVRLDPATMAALRAWASDDLRSLNGQIEFLLRRALREAGRLPAASEDAGRTASDREPRDAVPAGVATGGARSHDGD